jgi:hypothetical protein
MRQRKSYRVSSGSIKNTAAAPDRWIDRSLLIVEAQRSIGKGNPRKAVTE